MYELATDGAYRVVVATALLQESLQELAKGIGRVLDHHRGLGGVPQEMPHQGVAVPGEVGAKTGTAEFGQADASGALPTHTWMIATRGDLAVAVFVETGVSGSQTAGPLLEAFLR